MLISSFHANCANVHINFKFPEQLRHGNTKTTHSSSRIIKGIIVAILMAVSNLEFYAQSTFMVISGRVLMEDETKTNCARGYGELTF